MENSTTTTISPIQVTKNPKITWDTNYNKKLGNDMFIHIDLKPSTNPVRSSVERSEILITTADGSHEPVKVRVWDMAFYRLCDLPCSIVAASHEMKELSDFAHWFINKHQGKITVKDQVALYYYEKIL